MNTHGKVPMFKMRPHGGTLAAAIVVLVLGLAFFLQGHADPGDLPAHQRANFVLVTCIVVSGLLLIISTARMWFRHLWHDRYR